MKTSKMDMIDLIIALEGSEVEIVDYEDWSRVKLLAADLSKSQGYYGRLLRAMEEFEIENDYDLSDVFPIMM